MASVGVEKLPAFGFCYAALSACPEGQKTVKMPGVANNEFHEPRMFCCQDYLPQTGADLRVEASGRQWVPGLLSSGRTVGDGVISGVCSGVLSGVSSDIISGVLPGFSSSVPFASAVFLAFCLAHLLSESVFVGDIASAILLAF